MITKNTPLILLVYILGICSSFGQNDIPNPVPNFQNIKAGSLIIAMDNDNQAIPGHFNMKAYGLINELLYNDIPVKWSIRAGKGKDDIDFTANALRLYPTMGTPATYDFRSGPFIVDSVYATLANYVINLYGQNVAVYELQQDMLIDIRYTIMHKPRIAVLNNGGNSFIHAAVLNEAGIPSEHIDFIPAGEIFEPDGCYSFASEPHWEDHNPDTAQVYAIYRFVKLGGNFLAQCEGLLTYENADTLHSDYGFIKDNNNRQTITYHNADMPFLQIHGPLATIGGSVRSWSLAPGSTFRTNTYTLVQDASNAGRKTAAVHKSIDNTLVGGNVFYLGGHDYGTNTTTDVMNGRRMYMNAVLSPAFRLDTCALGVTLLPVQMQRFMGNYDGQVINVSWETLNETANKEFIVEKYDGNGKFFPVASVRGAGDSDMRRTYSIVDPNPHAGFNYYRIKQINFDGSSSYPANVIHVNVPETNSDMSIYPNPVSGTGFYIKLMNQPGNTVNLSITDIRGTLISQGRIRISNPDSETIYFEFPEQMAGGIYFASFENQIEKVVRKFIVQ